MMEPLPQLFSICAMARFSAFFLSSCIVETAILLHPLVLSWIPLATQLIVPEKRSIRYPNKIRRSVRSNQAESATENASSTCRIRTRSPSISTPTTSNRYESRWPAVAIDPDLGGTLTPSASAS